MTVRIRAATVGDASALYAAERETAKTPGFLVSRPNELHTAAFAARIAELEAPGHRGRYVVATGPQSEVLGHALLEPMSLAAISHIFRLTIVVHPGHTDRGVGRALMSDIVAWASSDHRVEKIELLVRATNERAIQLYRKFGFVEEGRFIKRIKLQDGRYLDDIAMALHL